MRAGADCPFSVSQPALRCEGLAWGCTYPAKFAFMREGQTSALG